MTWIIEEQENISRKDMLKLVRRATGETRTRRICAAPKRVLLLPPDITRAHSGAGWITEEFYRIFSKTAETHVIPTLGQHVPHTPEQNRWMFGSIPKERIHAHDWRKGSKIIGEVPAALRRYDPVRMHNGFNVMSDGKEVFYINTPSSGLWSTKEKLSEICKNLS